MFLEVDHSPRRDNSLTPRLSPRITRSPQRPTSLAIWDIDGTRENCYVDEPAIAGPGIVIRLSLSTPTSPAH